MAMREPQRGPADADARARAVQFAGSVLVQAPAGSGKTTLLTQRYLRLLAAVDAPEGILALTFTRRAAEEMRGRVAAALLAAQAAECPAGMNPETWRLAVAAARHLRAGDIDLARHPARLRIETIDAFNAWLAGQLPIAAGTGGALRMQNDASAYLIAARRGLAYVEADAFGAAVEHVLQLGDQRWAQLGESIAKMLPSRDRWLPLLAGSLTPAAAAAPAHLDEVRRQFDTDLAVLVDRALDAAARALGAERLEALAGILQRAAGDLPQGEPQLAAWRKDGGRLRPASSDLPRWREALAVVLKADGGIRASVTKSDGFAAKSVPKGQMQDLLAEIARDPALAPVLQAAAAVPEPRYSDAQWEAVRAVAQVLLLAAAELEGVFRERGMADFPAVAMAARRALGTALAPTDLALRLDYRLQHILIDEFQDTSGAQLELLRLLTAGWQDGDGRSVFCVGDPMQSIYGFREAEVRAFLQLADEGIGDLRFDVQRLSSNFRSARAVVDWVNATFTRILPSADDRDRGAIAYRPSTSATAPAVDADAGVQIRGFQSPGAEARAIADLVGATLAAHPGWRIAVLVRARRHAQGIAAALRTRGLAFRAVDIEPLDSRHVVRDLLTLTRSLLHLGDRSAWLALLRTPWIGLRLEDLLVVARADGNIWDALGDPAVLGQLSNEARVRAARAREVLAAALPLRGQSDIARWVERCWLAFGGPACVDGPAALDHANSALQRLRMLEELGLPDAAVLDEAFADLFAGDATASGVEIMTIHKAKGLEFDLVILPALERGISSHSDEFLLAQQFAARDRDAMIMAARPAVGADADRLFKFLQRRAREAAALEAERLLYVACTRAKSRLFLSASLAPAPPDDAAAEELQPEVPATTAQWRPRSGSLLAVLWPMTGPAFLESGRDGEPAPGGGEGTLRGGPLLRLPSGWTPPSIDAPFVLASRSVGAEPPTATPVFDWAGETARHVGSLVHAELQHLDAAEGAPAADVAAPAARAAHFERWLAARGVPRERLAEAVQRVVAALSAVQTDPRARWILRRREREDFREHALSGVFAGVVEQVVFDRCFLDADGLRWVIDYKTSEHLGGAPERFLDSEVERYRAQMQRYAAFARRMGPQPVRVGLYFPLMRAWREWEP